MRTTTTVILVALVILVVLIRMKDSSSTSSTLRECYDTTSPICGKDLVLEGCACMPLRFKVFGSPLHPESQVCYQSDSGTLTCADCAAKGLPIQPNELACGPA
jgi:hypothetical protein